MKQLPERSDNLPCRQEKADVISGKITPAAAHFHVSTADVLHMRFPSMHLF
jgi:hypothetical protein